MNNYDMLNINGILLLYKYPPGPNNLIDHVNSIEKYSKFKVWKINVLGGFPKELKTLRFSVIVLHYSFMYTLNYSNPASEEIMEYVNACSSSYKVAFFQDEHHTCQRRFKCIDEYKFGCIYTLLEPESVKNVYLKYSKVKKIISTLPCYVNDELVNLAGTYYKDTEKRPVDIGYRGRELPPYMGKGSQEKSEIAYKFLQHAQGLGMKLDIGSGEGERLYGDRWYRFISDCKAMLGVEAGVSIFDVEDAVKKGYDRICLIDNPVQREQEMRTLLDQWEDRIYYRTVSPRQFELAAFRTCQILYEGKYSGVVKPMIHYIPLKKDFSNFEDVIRMFNDKFFIRELTENAYKDLIVSDQYKYRSFVREFDRELESEGLTHELSESRVEEVTKLLNKGRILRNIKCKLKNPLYRHFPGRELLKSVVIRYMEKSSDKK